MRHFAPVQILGLALLVYGIVLSDVAIAADAPEDRVVAMYFHRTERCPTCKKMGAYSEEALKQGFTDEIKKGAVAFYFIDFQDPRNAKLAKGYRIEGPALIVAKIQGNKVAEYKNLEDIWTNVGDKSAFLKYVQKNVSEYLK
jgi:hypothetical protein